MSATNYSNRWVDMAVNWIGAAFIAAGIFYSTSSDADNKEFENRVNHNTISLESKADKDDVDKKIKAAITEYDKSQQILINGFKEVVEAGNKSIKELLTVYIDNHNKRIERLEEDKK